MSGTISYHTLYRAVDQCLQGNEFADGASWQRSVLRQWFFDFVDGPLCLGIQGRTAAEVMQKEGNLRQIEQEVYRQITGASEQWEGNELIKVELPDLKLCIAFRDCVRGLEIMEWDPKKNQPCRTRPEVIPDKTLNDLKNTARAKLNGTEQTSVASSDQASDPAELDDTGVSATRPGGRPWARAKMLTGEQIENVLRGVVAVQQEEHLQGKSYTDIYYTYLNALQSYTQSDCVDAPLAGEEEESEPFVIVLKQLEGACGTEALDITQDWDRLDQHIARLHALPDRDFSTSMNDTVDDVVSEEQQAEFRELDQICQGVLQEYEQVKTEWGKLTEEDQHDIMRIERQEEEDDRDLDQVDGLFDSDDYQRDQFMQPEKFSRFFRVSDAFRLQINRMREQVDRLQAAGVLNRVCAIHSGASSIRQALELVAQGAPGTLHTALGIAAHFNPFALLMSPVKSIVKIIRSGSAGQALYDAQEGVATVCTCRKCKPFMDYAINCYEQALSKHALNATGIGQLATGAKGIYDVVTRAEQETLKQCQQLVEAAKVEGEVQGRRIVVTKRPCTSAVALIAMLQGENRDTLNCVKTIATITANNGPQVLMRRLLS